MDGVSMMPVTFSMVGVVVLGLGLLLALLGLRLGTVNEETRRLERYVVEPALAPERKWTPLPFARLSCKAPFASGSYCRGLRPWPPF